MEGHNAAAKSPLKDLAQGEKRKMLNTQTLVVVCKLAAVVTIAVLGFCLLNGIQHMQLAEMYKVAGAF